VIRVGDFFAKRVVSASGWPRDAVDGVNAKASVTFGIEPNRLADDELPHLHRSIVRVWRTVCPEAFSSNGHPMTEWLNVG
jgi:hypothetical protein